MDSEEKNYLANWNGTEMNLGDVYVPALDRGFLFGDGVYEVIRVYGRNFFRLEDHLERMQNSLQSIEMKNVEIETVKKRLFELTSSSGLSDALIYCQITRGTAKRTHHYPSHYTPNVLMYIQPFSDPYKEVRETGANAATFKDIRWRRNDIKSTSLMANCMAASYASSNQCLEVIFIDTNGFITEGSHTSIFAIKDGNLLIAPAGSNVLPGITKRQVLEIAEKINLPVKEENVLQENIWDMDELFLAGTPEEIIPIVMVDNKPINDGKPGPIVKKLFEAFRNILDATTSSTA